MQCNCGGVTADASLVKGEWRMGFTRCRTCGRQSGYRLERAGTHGAFVLGAAALRLFDALPEHGDRSVTVRITEHEHFEGRDGQFSSTTTTVLPDVRPETTPIAPSKIPGAVLVQAASGDGSRIRGGTYDVVLPVGAMVRSMTEGYGWSRTTVVSCVTAPAKPPVSGVITPSDLPVWRDPSAYEPRQYRGRYRNSLRQHGYHGRA